MILTITGSEPMSGFDVDRYVYLPIWHMLCRLLILDSLARAPAPGKDEA
jgi:hypothetical protein